MILLDLYKKLSFGKTDAKICQVKYSCIIIIISNPSKSVYCTGLTQQLNQPGVGHVTNILDRAKSSYILHFLKLSRQIQVKSSTIYTCTVYVYMHKLQQSFMTCLCNDIAYMC